MQDPAILYKYRDWNIITHKDCLNKCEFFAASPSALNDPFDCKIEFDFSKLNSDKEIKGFFDNHIYQFAPNKSEEGYNNQLTDFKQYFNTQKEKFIREFNKHTFDLEDRIQGVLSLSSAWDEIKLWSHYANNHSGFSVGLDVHELMTTVDLYMCRKINYVETLPKINPNQDLVLSLEQRLFTKSIGWQEEKEYRFFRSWLKQGGFPNNQARIIKVRPLAIKEVLLGMNMKIEHEEEILNVCKSNNWRRV